MEVSRIVSWIISRLKMNANVLTKVIATAKRLVATLVRTGMRLVVCMNTPNMALQVFAANETLAATRDNADIRPFPSLA